jgi:hypothetical protein
VLCGGEKLVAARWFPLLGPPQNDGREPERHRAGEQQSERGSGNGAPAKALLSESVLAFPLAEKPGQEPDKQAHGGPAQESRRGGRGERMLPLTTQTRTVITTPRRWGTEPKPSDAVTPNHRLQLTGASGAALRGGLIADDGKRNVDSEPRGSSPAAEAGPLGATKDEVVHSKAIATLERF